MPAAGLVAEMNAGLQQLLDTYFWFSQLSITIPFSER
jgi:hypothetical protein